MENTDNYPLKIGDHKKKLWVHGDCFTGDKFNLTKNYIHYVDKPLLMHSHNFYEINVVIKGEGRYYINNNFCDATLGSVFITPPDVRHGYFGNEVIEVFHILLSLDFLRRYSEELNSLPGFSMLFEIEPYLRSNLQKELFLTLNKEQLGYIMPSINKLLSYNNSAYSGIEIAKNAAVIEIIAYFSKLIFSRDTKISETDQAKENSVTAAIAKTLEHIHSHFAEKIKIEALAKSLNMSRSTFLRNFKAVCGITPLRYQTELRIKKVKELLSYSNMPLSDIAQECGFYDSSHLIKIFTEFEKQSPLNYRKG